MKKEKKEKKEKKVEAEAAYANIKERVSDDITKSPYM